MKAILFCFEAVSGLKINFFKSELIGVKVGEDVMCKLADVFGCKGGAFTCILFRAASMSGHG